MNDVKFKEDKLFNKDIITAVEIAHDLRFVSYNRHMRIDGRECDVVAIFETAEGKYLRLIGFELKDKNFDKVVAQALERRKLFDYMYIVTGLSAKELLRAVLNYRYFAELVNSLKQEGIGIICENEVILYSKFRKGSLQPLLNFSSSSRRREEGGGVRCRR